MFTVGASNLSGVVSDNESGGTPYCPSPATPIRHFYPTNYI